ncbi:Hypothetical protein NTJ_05240 [Nesidiocoris tenuis]|uniref:THAP-type domain-containing protein n=1 Tax=Nesidiocoris tenuis TaxID=355587 RepID=A0ABN7AMG1_9HEMI|nr:Hypothetical protein NTJ_05240 [Nesidiocoris tenuis]
MSIARPAELAFRAYHPHQHRGTGLALSDSRVADSPTDRQTDEKSVGCYVKPRTFQIARSLDDWRPGNGTVSQNASDAKTANASKSKILICVLHFKKMR